MRFTALERAVSSIEGKDVLVAFSGGRDSMILVDLCSRVARSFKAFSMELVPGLRCFDEPIERAEARYGFKALRYPHWRKTFFAKWGVFRFHASNVPDVTLNDILALARHDSGITLVANGEKRSDSQARRQRGDQRFLSEPDRLCAPLWDWSSRDVAAYIKTQNVPTPYGDNRTTMGGVDLTVESVCHIHDHFPADYARIEAEYPFVGAIIERRRLYGIGGDIEPASVPLAERARQRRLRAEEAIAAGTG